ncbi:hypothetical protein Cgig2_014648 [Carnegiea gigantea]|uniref:Amino acid transporter transmembrane domain-containing protein n=1 Tax=Carnegiea gigantea TaxID=171969 RepID=A0A9Q1KZN4_9CARY|nr:hypothetical protein Cgig2_014648 [Carnegiea gigantea]
MSNPGSSLENGTNNTTDFDDDGKPRRKGWFFGLFDDLFLVVFSWQSKGTLLTASAHIITAVIGSGVLSLAWAVAQIGWIAGPLVLFVFSIVTWFCSTLLADCYRHPVTGARHYTYRQAVKSTLGGTKFRFLALAQYSNFIGVSIGYTITASFSMAAVKRAICFHKEGHKAGCHTTNNKFMILFGIAELILSQLPNFHKLSVLSVVAAIMSFGYSFIGIGLSIAQIIGGNHGRTSLIGVQVGVDVTLEEKIWNILTAMGNMAFAYAFSMVLIEIQDTLKSGPPENVVMKKASLIGIVITTTFYLLCGLTGYAVFGNDASGNFLTGFGFYEPYWLIALANVCIAVHLVGAYQVFCQPFYDFVETQCAKTWPANKLIKTEHPIKVPLLCTYNFNMLRLVCRTIYVVTMTVIAMLFPFFNDFVGFIGAFSFWPLTIYFPIEMYIVHAKIVRFSSKWILLKLLSYICLIVSLLAVAASVRGLVVNVTSFKPFQSVS